MLVLIVILRFLHIVFGIFWVGAALMLTFFVSPAARATKENGQKFLTHMMSKTPFNPVIMTSSLTSVISGVILYGIDSNWFTSGWMTSGPGMGFGLGGVAGLIGLHYGILQNRRSKALIALGQTIQTQGAPPSAEQQTQIQTLRAKLKSGGTLNAVFLLLSSILMATARFWVF